MFTRRIARAAVVAPRSLRAFSSTAANQRTPILADITPDGVDSFNSKQKDFREQLVKAQQEREASRSTTTPSDPINNSLAGARESTQGLGSLSTHTGQRAEASTKEPDRPDGLLSRVIYGTKEGRELDAQLEASFSAVLARGKYVHSIVFHQVKPDKVDEYVELVGTWYPRMASIEENKVHLVGSWRTEVGDCDTFVHIWEYQRYQGYHQSLHSISRHPDFPEFDKKLKTLVTSKNTSIMQEFSFWPTTSPRQLGGLFELRSYTLHPGNLLEWETHWRRGLKARREVMEGVGAWFVQIGDLNTVHHLWQFANLEERKVRREESWKQEGWAETVHKTVPLIQTMKSRILIPMPWSPVA
ncbi:NIPSNAP-domain-containing protein [Annulohypoxylon truncatum]|uniref:NIPSNAP-domain-containing protein n=1 Tax=Annulohypoxylon truncatum TaxID=327061 RepID=UPI0020081086|nr:NIPSNAP-domain-containing protein [Annulohypoxylon truncatum]KAI1204894.1 NIPSNAP-domain-containing protein [Annulohypoxylon truncatum]